MVVPLASIGATLLLLNLINKYRVSRNVSSDSHDLSLGARPNRYDMVPKRNSLNDSHASNRKAHSYSSQFLWANSRRMCPLLLERLN